MASPESQDDQVVAELALNNPGLLARLLAVQGLTELESDGQCIVASAVDTLLAAIPDEDMPEEVAQWLDTTHPPMVEDFRPEERWYIGEYARISPLLGLVREHVPGTPIPIIDNREIVSIPPNDYL